MVNSDCKRSINCMPEKIPVQIDQEKQRTTHSEKIHIQIQQKISNSLHIAKGEKKKKIL